MAASIPPMQAGRALATALELQTRSGLKTDSKWFSRLSPLNGAK